MRRTGELLGQALSANFLGYFTAGKRLTTEELQAVQGRIWEE
jgi:hypothetical protein